MKTIANFLRGTVRLQVSGVELERFLNRCAQARLAIWAVEREAPFVLSFLITRRDLPRLEAIAASAQCSIERKEPRGLPFFLLQFRKRYALLAGLLLFCTLIFLGSRTLLIIEVEGNQTVTTAEILSLLRQHGVRPGIYTPAVERGRLSNDILLQMDALSFFAINFHGIRAEVIVREKVPMPQLLDEGELTDVISAATGIVTAVEPLAGQPMIEEGQTILKGELLIRGLVEIPGPMYSETILGFAPTHAQGRVYARTWHSLTAAIPLRAAGKEPTGEEKTRYALNLLGHRFNFYQNGRISFEKYDKITESKQLSLRDGTLLPIGLEKETFRAYETVAAELCIERAEQMLIEQLFADLDKLLPEEGDEILTSDVCSKIEKGVLKVTLLAECAQQVGREVAGTLPEGLFEPEAGRGLPQS